MIVINWISDNYIEIFGALTGIIYVFLEIRQNIWLWPVGIATSTVYIIVFFTGKLYADMSLQGYYLIISVIGWYWWVKGSRVLRSYSEGGGRRAQGAGGEREMGRMGEGEKGRRGERENGRRGEKEEIRFDEEDVRNGLPSLEGLGVGNGKAANLVVSNIRVKTSIILILVFLFLYITIWFVLDNFTDSPVPGWDSFITSLSIIATWMLARKIIEHWYLWIVVNFVAVILFLSRGLYPTVALYAVYCVMSFIGLKEWRKSLPHRHPGDIMNV